MGGSSKLINPGKKFFFKLAADAVREASNMKDSNGTSYVRKAMIMTGISLGYDGTWSESHLTQALQVIISQHRGHFDGWPVTAEDIETQS